MQQPKLYIKEVKWITISNHSERNVIKLKPETTQAQIQNEMNKFVMSLN